MEFNQFDRHGDKEQEEDIQGRIQQTTLNKSATINNTYRLPR